MPTKDKEKRKAQNARSYLKHKEKIDKNVSEYDKAHKEEIRVYKQEYYLQRHIRRAGQLRLIPNMDYKGWI